MKEILRFRKYEAGAVIPMALRQRGITVITGRRQQRRPENRLRKRQRRSNALAAERLVGYITGLYALWLLSKGLSYLS